MKYSILALLFARDLFSVLHGPKKKLSKGTFGKQIVGQAQEEEARRVGSLLLLRAHFGHLQCVRLGRAEGTLLLPNVPTLGPFSACLWV
jgi:hypothetical protein